MSPIEPVNIFSEAHKRDPFPFYTRLRAEAPVFKTTVPIFGDVWLVTRYDDVVACLKDDTRLVKDPRRAGRADRANIRWWMPQSLKALEQNMLDLDDPEHRRLRTLVNKVFTRRRVEALEARTQEIADELLDRMGRKGAGDLVADYALQLPLIVICELLGVPAADRGKFHNWSRRFMESASEIKMALSLPAILAFIRYLKRLFAARRTEPREDLVTALVEAEEAGDRLNEHELTAMIIILLIAGHETTANLIGSGTLAVLENPDQRHRLTDDGIDVETAVEELLRFAAPVETTTERYAAEEISLQGATIPKGGVMFAVLASANRDETTFEDPDRLDLARAPNPSIAFGQGIHYCLGAQLAKMEAGIAFASLFRRFPDLRLARPGDRLRWRETPVVRGLKTMPVQF